MNDFERKEYKNLLSDYIKASERILELEKENQELTKEKNATIILMQLMGKDTNNIVESALILDKYKKAIEILKDYVKVAWLTDTLYSDKDRYVIELYRNMFDNLAVIEIPYEKYELLDEVFNELQAD